MSLIPRLQIICNTQLHDRYTTDLTRLDVYDVEIPQYLNVKKHCDQSGRIVDNKILKRLHDDYKENNIIFRVVYSAKRFSDSVGDSVI